MTACRGRVPGLLIVATIIGSQLAVGASAQSPSTDPARVAQPTLTAAVDTAIGALATELGGDPAAVRAWVAEQVVAETYPGVLKGARGAYLTTSANSADRALLQAALIRAADPTLPVRYATCEIGTPAAPSASTPVEWPLDHADEIAAAVADPQVAAAVVALRDYRTRSKERTTAAAMALETALATVAEPLPPSAPSDEAITQHVWLQVEEAGAWIDQDPSSVTGAAPCAAATTVDALPEALSHRVRFALTLERNVAGQLQESTPLEAAFAVADLAASRIAFGFGEPIGLIERAPDDGMIPRAYSPVLRIDNESVAGTSFTLPPVPAAEDDGGGGLDPFGGLGGGLGGEEPATEIDPVTAAWLDIELTAPDGTVTSLRSDVFDRIGIVARASDSAATATVEALPVAGTEYASLATLWQIGLLLGEPRAEGPSVDSSLDIVTVDGVSGTIDGLLRLFPALRRDLGGATSGPVVLLAGLGPVTGPEKRGGLQPGEVATQLTFDALHVPAPQSTDRAEAAQDAQAIVGAEGMLVALSGGSVDPLGDATAVFAAASSAGVPMLTVRPGDVPQVSGASPQALARMTDRLADGYTLLTPATAPAVYGQTRTAWWVIDPVTGVIRDEHESGRHQANVEYGGTNAARQSSTWQQFCNFANGLRTPIFIAAVALYAATGGHTGGGMISAINKIAQGREAQRRTAEKALQIACPGQSPSSGPPLP